MQYFNKQLITNALPTVFETEVIKVYLETTTYRRKKSFIENIKNTGELMRYFCPMSSLTTCQHNNFRELCRLQLEHAMAKVENEQMQNFFQLIHGRFIGHPLNIGQLQNMINKKEERIFKNLLSGDYSHQEMVQFLRIVLLFSDKDFHHGDEVKQIIRTVCATLS